MTDAPAVVEPIAIEPIEDIDAVETDHTPEPDREGYNWPLLIGLTLLGLAIRWLLLPLVVWPPVDAVHYLNQARNGPWATTWSPIGGEWFLPPLYPTLVALFGGSGADPGTVVERAKLASLLVGTLTPPALYWAFRPLLGRPLARWVLLLAAVDPLLCHYSAVVISEPLYLLLLVLMLGTAIRWTHGWATGAILTAGLGVLAYWTRAFGIVLFPLVFLGVWWSRAEFGPIRGPLRKQAKTAGAIFLVLTIAYIGLVSVRMGRLAWDGKSQHQFIRLSAPNLTLEERDPNYEGRIEGQAYAPETPWFDPLKGGDKVKGAVRKYVMRHQRIWLRWLTGTVPPYGTPLFSGITLLLMGVGAALIGPRVRSRAWRVWLTLGGGIALLQPLTFIEIRYFIWLVPLALPLAAVALDEGAKWLKARTPRGLEPTLIPAGVALLVCAYNAMGILPSLEAIADEDHQRNPYLEAASAIAQGPERPRAILDTSGIAGFYLGVPGYVIPDVVPEDLAQFARSHGASALVLDEALARTKHNRILLQFLYDVPQDYPQYGLWLLDQDDSATGKGWRAYTFVPPPGTLDGGP